MSEVFQFPSHRQNLVRAARLELAMNFRPLGPKPSAFPFCYARKILLILNRRLNLPAVKTFLRPSRKRILAEQPFPIQRRELRCQNLSIGSVDAMLIRSLVHPLCPVTSLCHIILESLECRPESRTGLSGVAVHWITAFLTALMVRATRIERANT